MTTSGNNSDRAFWTGATVGVAAATVLLCGITGYFVVTGIPRWVEAAAFAAVGTLVLIALALVASLVAHALRDVPPRFFYVAVAAMGTLYLLGANRFRFRWDPSLFYPAAIVFLAAVAMLFGVFHARGTRGERGGLAGVALIVLVAGVAWIRDDGRDPYPVDVVRSTPSTTTIPAENPGDPGSYDVERLTYGSGTDSRRPEFGDGVSVKAPTVDGSKILPEWKGFRARAREWYWGFSIERAPLNARVWMPVGEGPFPLVLVVHGNHAMEDHSDPGYAYLGELLASRGFITASVDENFVNGTWSGDFRGQEMPIRAWLLLEHLRVWHQWNQTPGHRFHRKVDTEKIALVGHSRGGEAVSLAYAFNRLEHFPDDATVRFDYGFSIAVLVAIAQTDRHYPRRIELDNVNFLTLQGSYDSDEASSFGMRQFRRIRLDDEPYRFKAGLYVHGANHGQFNSTWGMDARPPSSWLLNRAALISAEDQRRIAKVYVAAFLEATLGEDARYRALFRDPRAGAAWLPDGIVYLAQFRDSTFRAVADFEEDMDVTTASHPDAVVETEGLTVWREEALRFRDDLSQGTNGVVIGSNGRDEGSYRIRFGAARPSVDASSSLTFFLSSSPEKVGVSEPSSLSLSVELVDASGNRESVDLDGIAPIAPPLKIRFLKTEWLNRKRFPRNWEPTFQHYEIPLGSFAGVALNDIAGMRFIARGSGVVILDDIGFRGAADPGPR